MSEIKGLFVFADCAQMFCYKILKEMQHCNAAVRKLPGLTCGDTNGTDMRHAVVRSNCSINFTPVHFTGTLMNLSQGFFGDPNQRAVIAFLLSEKKFFGVIFIERFQS